MTVTVYVYSCTYMRCSPGECQPEIQPLGGEKKRKRKGETVVCKGLKEIERQFHQL